MRSVRPVLRTFGPPPRDSNLPYRWIPKSKGVSYRPPCPMLSFAELSNGIGAPAQAIGRLRSTTPKTISRIPAISETGNVFYDAGERYWQFAARFETGLDQRTRSIFRTCVEGYTSCV